MAPTASPSSLVGVEVQVGYNTGSTMTCDSKVYVIKDGEDGVSDQLAGAGTSARASWAEGTPASQHTSAANATEPNWLLGASPLAPVVADELDASDAAPPVLHTNPSRGTSPPAPPTTTRPHSRRDGSSGGSQKQSTPPAAHVARRTEPTFVAAPPDASPPMMTATQLLALMDAEDVAEANARESGQRPSRRPRALRGDAAPLPPRKRVAHDAATLPAAGLQYTQLAFVPTLSEQPGRFEGADKPHDERPGQSPSVRPSRVAMTNADSAALPPVVEGEDYYFYRVSGTAREGATPRMDAAVALGRVVAVRASQVTLRCYEVKDMALRHSPVTGELERQLTVYLGPRSVTVPARFLLFDIPVYVVRPSELRHVYVLDERESAASSGRASPEAPSTAAPERGTALAALQTATTELVPRSSGSTTCDSDADSAPDCAEDRVDEPGAPTTDAAREWSHAWHQRFAAFTAVATPREGSFVAEMQLGARRVGEGSVVCFRDHYSGEAAPVHARPLRWGRVAMLRRVHGGVVLVVHTESENSVFGGSKMCVITPDMLVEVLPPSTNTDCYD